MSLEARIAQDLKEAMKAKDEAAKRGIRAIKAAILLAKTDGSGKELNEEGEIKLLQKLAKQRKESLETYEKNNREDLAQIEREELVIIEKYLPEQMDDAELESFLKKVIDDNGASGMKDMGKIMGIASKQLAGRADGKKISVIVRKLLS